MNPSTLLNRPTQKITPHITKINSLVDSSEKIKKSSAKLRKVFEKGTYQKKTQLSILNRYKRRLNTIQNQNDKRFTQKRQVKIKPPEVKKFAGGFFSGVSSSDPLKSLAALAALNAFQKGSKGNYGGALASALVASGLLFGPSLIRGGIGAMRGGGSSPATPSQSAPTGGGLFRGTPYSQTGAGKAYAGMQSQRNLPKWAQRAAGGSASRFAASNERMFQGTANIGDRARVASRRFGFSGIGGVAENIAARGGGVSAGATTSRAGGSIAAKTAGVGTRAIPLLGTALSVGLSAYRFSQGDVVGGILSAVSAIPMIGWAALGVDLAREFGVFDGTILGRKGKEKLKRQTEQQKKLVEKRETGGTLTFNKSLDRYERVVNKFEKFSKNFTVERKTEGYAENIPPRSPTPIADPYTGPISGETFIPLPGATSIGDPSQGQNYGAGRGGRSHQGIDLTELKQQDSRAPIAAYKTGKVIKVESGDIYPGGGIEIDHGDGLVTRYLHVTPSVSVGDTVYGGQQIGNLFRYYRGNQEQTHLHFEVYKNNQLMDPTSYVTGAKNKINSPLTPERAKQHHESTSKKSPGVSPTATQRTAVPATSASRSTSPVLNAISGDIVEESIIEQPAPKQRSISKSMHYSPVASGSPQSLAIPFPIIETSNQQMPVSEGSGTMISSGSKDMLNSFYKRVLLNQLV